MSDKPSLYVVEKKEVVILVVLFVLVTVLSFTMGVKYGESVGKKVAREQAVAEEELGDAGEGRGGTLGKSSGAENDSAAAKGHKEEAAHGAAKEETGHGEAAKTAPSSSSPEVAAQASRTEPPAAKGAVDKNADEYLLNALKESGVEPPGGKAPNDAKLPQEVKRVRSGSYVIQVGSHPTRSEAESQIRQLRARKVSAEVLPPFKDRQGEWHRVVLGSFKSKREAEREALQLKARGAFVSFFVWRLP